MSLLLLNEDELRQTISIPEAIETVKAALEASAEGRLHVPGDFALDLPDVKGDVEVKGAYLQEAPYFVVKIASSFRKNPSINLPIKSGLLAVCDAATGFPAAIMLDNGYLANIRAGMVGALAAQHLAHEQLDRVAIIGSGSQASAQLKALMTVRSFRSVAVWSRTPMHADTYARRMVEDHDLNIQIAPTPRAAVDGADLIITATASPQPLIKADWLKPGAHLTAVGGTSPGRRELHPEVLQRADVIVVDDLDRSVTAGEIYHGLSSGAITRQAIQGELGSLITGKIPGRTSDDQVTLAILSGLDAQDAVVATLAMEKALFLGLGQRLETGLGQPGLGWRAATRR